jgi:hypothetical protein
VVRLSGVNLFVEGLLIHHGRTDRTPIELFMAAAISMEAIMENMIMAA